MRRCLLGFALLLAVATARTEPPVAIAVIVHPQRTEALDPGRLAQIYLRRSRFWSDGSAVVPLNLPADSNLRSRFGRRILRQTDAQLANYWNRRYFDGVFPPATLASTTAMKHYVASDRNAIGYLPADEVDASVRSVFRIE